MKVRPFTGMPSPAGTARPGSGPPPLVSYRLSRGKETG